MISDDSKDKSVNWKDPFEVLEACTDHGAIGLGGDLGYSGLVVTNSARFKWLISAHANSRIIIKIHRSLILRGFLNGTASYCGGVEFFVDGALLGPVESEYDTTSPISIPPGLHVLEARHRGSNSYCHSVWGFNDAEDDISPPPFGISVAAFFEERVDCLEKWIRHHLMLGFEHIFILDNRSDSSSLLVSEWDALKEFVTIEKSPDWGDLDDRIESYRYLIEKYGPLTKWMALLDPGEFLVQDDYPSLERFLSAYEDFGGIRIGTAKFEHGGTDGRPRLGDVHEKCILQPRFVLEVMSPHQFTFMHGRPAVGESFREELSSLSIRLDQDLALPQCGVAQETSSAISSSFKSLSNFVRQEPLGQWRSSSILPLHRANDGEETASSHDPRIAGFIHIAAVNHWKSILLSQLRKMRGSGLYDRTSVIFICIVGGNATAVIEALALSAKFSLISSEGTLEDFEFPTLKALEKYCRDCPLDFVWYIHSKGVVHADDSRTRWRAKMESFVICNFEIAIAKLETGYGAAGSYGVTDRRWPIPGNFWWARADFINALPAISTLDLKNRWHAEGWIGLLGSEYLYWRDSGDTIFPSFKIAHFQVGAGIIATNGSHSWLMDESLCCVPIPVRLPSSWRRDHVISSHAPSFLCLQCSGPLEVFGFVCGTASRGDWEVQFLIDGESLGCFDAVLDRTPYVTLSPGEHTLEIRLSVGYMQGCHTAWGVSERDRGSHGNVRLGWNPSTSIL